ncbi:MAG: condensation domain-containing protein, partial [Sediminibacterium sp.]|nr:condensation domain-containing protein [Sediminibacterium sp.]
EYNNILTSWQDNFKLFAEKPLYSIGYIEGFDDGSCRIFFALHHLISDAVTMRIIVHDLNLLYTKLLSVSAVETILKQDSEQLLGCKGTSFRQWSEIIRNYSITNNDERIYWEKQLIGLSQAQSYLESLVVSETTANYIEFELEENLTTILLTKTKEVYNAQINEILLSAFSLCLTEFTQNLSNYISMKGHGREDILNNLDVTNTIGWFATLYPVKLTSYPESLAKTIEHTKEYLKEIPYNGIGYGAIFGYDNRLPRICFDYVGQLNQNREISGWKLIRDNEIRGTSISSNNLEPNIIDVNSFVVNNQLIFKILTKLSKEESRRFVEIFKNKLMLLVSF